MCDWFSWKILNSCLNGPGVDIMSSALEDWEGAGGSEVRGFDIVSLISCFSAAWRLTLMHWKDVVLTAHQHIHVRSPLAQESSGLRIIHSERMKWKWVCPTVLPISHLRRKIKSWPKGLEMTMKPEEKGKNCMGLGFL